MLEQTRVDELYVGPHSQVHGVLGDFPPAKSGRFLSIAFLDGGMMRAAWPSASESVTTGNILALIPRKAPTFQLFARFQFRKFIFSATPRLHAERA
jgi:hypothetical protein